jgi:hypothetical protein
MARREGMLMIIVVYTLPTKYPSSKNIPILIYFLDISTMLKYLVSKIFYTPSVPKRMSF